MITLYYQLAENRRDDLAVTREYFIETPCGRMSVRMPEFLSMQEQLRRMKVIVDSLNHAELQPRGRNELAAHINQEAER